MKTVIFFVLGVSAINIVLGYTYQTIFSGSNGKEDKIITCNHDRTLNLDVSCLKVYFYDFQNNYTKNYLIGDAAEKITKYMIKKTFFGKRLFVFVPGFTSKMDSVTVEWIRDAIRSLKNKYLVIIDYSEYTDSALTAENFEKALPYGYYIGKAAAKFLANLYIIQPENIHIIGHSFGSQISGYIGDSYRKITLRNIWRITGIEPSKQCFYDAPIKYRLSTGKANYVEVFHCTKNYGTSNTVGDVDLLYNKELEAQPGCYDGIFIRGLGNVSAAQCDHEYCVKFWANTVTQPDLYEACNSYEEYVVGECYSRTALAGYHIKGYSYGVFYASTEISGEIN